MSDRTTRSTNSAPPFADGQDDSRPPSERHPVFGNRRIGAFLTTVELGDGTSRHEIVVDWFREHALLRLSVPLPGIGLSPVGFVDLTDPESPTMTVFPSYRALMPGRPGHRALLTAALDFLRGTEAVKP